LYATSASVGQSPEELLRVLYAYTFNEGVPRIDKDEPTLKA